jgi:hypothetical protein
VARRRRDQLSVSFFSFLDIMTSFMGTLMLILICVTLIAMKMEKKDIYIKIKADKLEEKVKEPIFVECTKHKLIIHPSLAETPLEKIEDKHSPFMRLVYNLDRNAYYIIFAIRPGGVESFKKARAQVEALDIDLGFEPVDQGWKIKLEKKDEPPADKGMNNHGPTAQ